ncbi:aldehyde dehydrogenase [Rhodoplanes sp. Z2-YC6860]|uniref:aldehyde dehydrogenase n=1 Tax=Rhodoplanes sp. Z2-YC6860 TaxID=674703 RepID=UPI00078D2E95|nr:aldehyde dehydrogenase [Rhodoplanes sp. Z2-YC6860]AMN39262.1 aldehyde dehydrogenase [Rhodoplanes sp. Z2-YC6860]
MDQPTLQHDKLYIGGEWRRGRGAEITSNFPADGSLNAHLPGASLEDVDLAIERAQDAAADPAWRHLLPHERASYLYRIADGIAQSADRISQVQSRDTGKTLTETRALAMSAAGTFRYMAATLETMEDALTPSRGNFLTMSVYEPLGVTAGITPWNSPIASDAQKVAPALAAGNAILLKPSSWSPLVCLELARVIEAAGLPKGLFSTLPGAGSIVGERLVTHPAIRKVSFTGGTETGRDIARKAADKLMPVSLELGGKSPAIVFADADLDVACAGVMFGIFSSTGQSCIAGSRLFVERSIYDAFVAKLVAATKRLHVGHPFEAATQVAPLIRPKHRDEVEGHVKRARDDGGVILTGGERPAGVDYAGGTYYLPTIIAGLDNTASLCRDEVFGPVLAVLPFDDEADLIRQCNDNSYGLACGIYTGDFPKAWRVARAIDTGTVWINTYKQFSISTPFGGTKDSGLGREKGRDGIRAWMAQKSLYCDLSQAPHPWAKKSL